MDFWREYKDLLPAILVVLLAVSVGVWMFLTLG